MPAYKCFNPYKLKGHKNKNVRKVDRSKIMGNAVPEQNLFLCDKCRKQVLKEGWPKNCDSKPSTSSTFLKNSEEFESENEFKSENESDSDFEKAPLKVSDTSDDLLQIIENLKNKFHNPLTNQFQKYEILKFMPVSWSDRKVAKTIGCSRQQVKNARQGKVNQVRRNALSEDYKNLVTSFYENDINSRLLPGKKDFISVKQSDGKRIHQQKRLILCNLSELYNLFKIAHPDCKIGFSTFARLRPKHCVLAGSSGTHSVCVCTYHENVHLMIDGASIPSLTESSDLKLTSYKDCLKVMVCENSKPECHSGDCNLCQNNIDIVKDHLNQLFESNGIEEIQYQIWESTDRSTLLSRVQDSQEFVDELCEKLIVLRNHDFVAKQQASYLEHLKQTLKEGEILLLCDFAENYAFVAQNAAQSFHWNNNQVSIHTAVYYYVENKKLKNHSMVVLSDDLSHNTVAVHAFQRILMAHLTEQNLSINKIIYFTDGAAQHYKNRFNFANLLNHKKDFGIDAEWHFHETSHGKGPCDGVGGNLKRLAARASLQLPPSKQILTAEALFNWAKENLTLTSVYFSSKEEHNMLETSLKERFFSAKRINGTQKYHAFIPINGEELLLKTCSNSDKTSVFPPKRGRKRKSA